MKKRLITLISFSLIFIFSLCRCGGRGSGSVLYNPVPLGILSISGGPIYDFGSHLVDSETVREFTVTNIGGGSAKDITGNFYFSLSFTYLGGSYPGTGGTCGGELAPDSQCKIVVQFSPKALGLTQTSLQLSYFNGSSSVVTSSPLLTGTGI